MLAAGHKPQAKAGLIQHHVGADQSDQCQQHEPVELKAVDIHQKCLFCIDILNGGGHVVHALGGVHGLDEHGGRGGAQQIHGGAHQRLVGLEVDGRHAQQQGVEHAQQDGGQHHQHDHHDGAGPVWQELHHQRAAQCAHDHDALQADVDHAGVF